MKKLSGATGLRDILQVKGGDQFKVPCEARACLFGDRCYATIRVEGLDKPIDTIVRADLVSENNGVQSIPVIALPTYSSDQTIAFMYVPGDVTSKHTNPILVSADWLLVNGVRIKGITAYNK